MPPTLRLVEFAERRARMSSNAGGENELSRLNKSFPLESIMRIFGIRGALGLFLTILILKFLVSGPFGAFEKFLVSFFNTLEGIPNSALLMQAQGIPSVQRR